ncbi:M48 family metalloprotease [Pusillimonas sp. NJUB218]|uniref:M48 family metalloprotease n=1 Tax=Pusillimonas sp. NJUB218 TaxID=2023230 RepID=UPI001F195B94|nr:M48 family metalloprotease [Pusillimonas sp. NJUB218]
MKYTGAAVLVFALFAPVAGQAQPMGLPSMGSASSAELSPALEKTLGDAIMEQGRRDPTYIDDPDVSQYLNEMGRKLSGAAGSAAIDVFGVRDPSINAFALPGGYVGINSGLVVASTNESQLASVVAHEIGHVNQRHVARGMTQSNQSSHIAMASIAGALLAAIAGAGDLAAGVAAFGQAAAVDRQLGFSRMAEQEADRAGVEMLRRAGYDPVGMVQMFERLGTASRLNEGAGGGSYASTHPLSIQRMSDIENRVRALPPVRRNDTDAYWFVRAKLRVIQSRDSLALRNTEAVLRQDAQSATGVPKAAAWYGLAYLAWQRKDLDEAAKALQNARADGIYSPQIAGLEADIALSRGDNQKAVDAALKAFERWPDNQALGMVVARALQADNQPEKAVQMLTSMIKKWPDEPRFYQMQALSLERMGRPVQARRAMAVFYEKTGALPTAVSQLQQARGMTQDFYVQSELDVEIRTLQERVRRNRELLEQFR